MRRPRGKKTRRGTKTRRRSAAALMRAIAGGDPSALAAVTIARTAEARGGDLDTLLFVMRLHDITERHKQPTAGAVLTRDPVSGAYGGLLPTVVERLRPWVGREIPDAQLAIAYDAIWQARTGLLVPPEPGGLRGVGKR